MKSLFSTAEIEGDKGLEKYVVKIVNLRDALQNRFSNFERSESEFRLFSPPFSLTVEKAPQLLLGKKLLIALTDLQCSNILKDKLSAFRILEFYQSLAETYPVAKSFVLRMLSLFLSTHMREQIFLVLNINSQNCAQDLVTST